LKPAHGPDYSLRVDSFTAGTPRKAACVTWGKRQADCDEDTEGRRGGLVVVGAPFSTGITLAA